MTNLGGILKSRDIMNQQRSIWSRLAEKLMLLNCGVGEDS